MIIVAVQSHIRAKSIFFYSTIQSAIDAANDGDTIFVYDDSSSIFVDLLEMPIM